MFDVESMPNAYLLLRLLNLQTCGELREVIINRGNNSGDGWGPPNGARTRVGDVHANQHSRLIGIPQPSERRKGPRRIDQLVIDTAHLHVDLQGDVRKVLELAFVLPELGHLDTDAGNLEVDVHKILDTVIDVFVTARENNQDHGWFLRVLPNYGFTNGFNSISANGFLPGFPREGDGSVEGVTLNSHTGSLAHVRQTFDSPSEFRVIDALELVPIVAIADEEDRPFRQPATNGELDRSKVPARLLIDARFALAIVNSGRGQKTPRNNSHLLANADAESVKGTGSLFESETLQAFIHDETGVDVGRSRGDFDHFGSMFVGQFAAVGLVWKYIAEFWREEVLFVASDIHESQFWAGKDDIIL